MSASTATSDTAAPKHGAGRLGKHPGVILRAGTLVETGTADDVLTGPGHPYTRWLLAPVPGADRTAPALHSGASGVDGRAHDGSRSNNRSR